MDNRLTYRATLLKDWMGSESYALVQTMLQELYDRRIQGLIGDGAAQHDRHVGHLFGLQEALRLAEQTVLDEQRQRPQEA